MASFRALPPSLMRQGSRVRTDGDPDARRIHVPVARAMVLVQQKGLPARTESPSALGATVPTDGSLRGWSAESP